MEYISEDRLRKLAGLLPPDYEIRSDRVHRVPGPDEYDWHGIEDWQDAIMYENGNADGRDTWICYNKTDGRTVKVTPSYMVWRRGYDKGIYGGAVIETKKIPEGQNEVYGVDKTSKRTGEPLWGTDEWFNTREEAERYIAKHIAHEEKHFGECSVHYHIRMIPVVW